MNDNPGITKAEEMHELVKESFRIEIVKAEDEHRLIRNLNKGDAYSFDEIFRRI